MSLPQHEWLSPEDQAIMDSATGSASNYTHITLVKWNGLRKDQRKLIPSVVEVEAADWISTSTLAPRVGHDYGLGNGALVRCKPGQAALILAQYPTAKVHADPTGEQWGNLLIDQATMKARKRTHLCNPHSNAKSIISFGLTGAYGTTLADLGKEHAKGTYRKLNKTPRIDDWPDTYVANLRDNEFYGYSDDEILPELILHHGGMRFGRHVDLNIQQGFYMHLGDGQVTICEGEDSGHVIDVIDSVCDGISITTKGDIDLPSSEFAHYYVDAAADKVSWVFSKPKGPWLLTADYHERKGDEFYFLVVRFLNADDDAAFVNAFRKEAQA